MREKVSSGDVVLGKPLSFAIYSEEGRLLLQKGQVVTSRSLLDRIFRIGYREGVSAGRAGPPRSGYRGANDNADRGADLIISGHAHAKDVGDVPLPQRQLALPDLASKVEFFHLTREEGREQVQLALIGVVPEIAIIGRAIADEDIRLQPGATYEARLFAGARLYRFATQWIQAEQGALGCLYLSYPGNISQALVRKQYRVPTALPGRIRAGNYERIDSDVVIENISVAGAGVTLPDDSLIVGVANGTQTQGTPTHGTETIQVTVSLGATEHRPGENYSQTVSRADGALREAKRNGRNQCVFVPGGTSTG